MQEFLLWTPSALLKPAQDTNIKLAIKELFSPAPCEPLSDGHSGPAEEEPEGACALLQVRVHPCLLLLACMLARRHCV